ncbi:MAG TPA: DUF5916 domain-containing protein, partial [Gemmatimonadales bacterium]|nr:DUF5916 domain-containing protein [Gemmatimonadales bacterium]
MSYTPVVLTPLLLALTQAGDSSPALAVPRRVDTGVSIDGRLDEPVWSEAAVLRGFSQYLPNDNRPADDSTTVLVWYSPTAIYFGIRAYEDSTGVRATLADRDKISGDDYVQILLDTYHDQRQALVFGVNPLGIQADGTVVDAARQVATTLSAASTGAYTLDLTPDYVYESKGRLTAWGYEVEIRIPFKTLRYQTADAQDWGINVIRMVQATGHTLTWTRVLQTRASFLRQNGSLSGLTGLHRGVVLDVTPEVTSTVTGAPAAPGWSYAGGSPRVGATVRWGATSNLTFNGTVRPDFSQVEADAPQIQLDPRAALNFPEKRPFFLDGLELFQTPIQLVYTKRLVDPEGAAKLTGKVGSTTVAVLSGVDGTDASASGSGHPVLNALRLREDLGGADGAGLVYTDRIDGPAFNRVGALDARVLLGGAWDLAVQGGTSATRDSAGAPVRWGPVWRATLVHSGRNFSLTVSSRGAGENFHTATGFVSRTDFATLSAIPSYTVVGRPGSWLESFNANVFLGSTWDQFRDFTSGRMPGTTQADFATGLTLRGGWQVGVGWSIESFGYPVQLFANDWVERVRGGGAVVDTVPFTGTPRLPNLDLSGSIQTPNFRTVSFTASLLVGRDDENFFEWASGHLLIGNLDLVWRPTDRLRAELVYNHQQVNRPSDGSTVSLIRIPRLKVEYQLSRPIFFRMIAQYTSNHTDSLRDDS